VTAIASPRTHVLIATDRLPARAELRHALEPELRCSEAVDPDSAVAAAVRDRPDVCVLDFATRGVAMLAANRIAAEVPSAGVIVLTGEIDEDEFMEAVRVGASGYLPQGLDPVRLAHVVRGVLRGEPAIPRRFVSRLIDELRIRDRRRRLVVPGRGRIELTGREWEVVELLLRGATTADIAAELGLSPVTVRRHFGSVERKLGVTTRAEVVELLGEALQRV
jgi:DNA-binding NarL/FixJ family response regulator